MGETKIEWATHTSNWLAGCTRVSPACQHCYAETMSARIATMPQAPARYRDGVVEGRRWTGRVTYDRDALAHTFAGLADAKSPRRVFVNSMSDTFHSTAPPESLTDLASAIRGLDAVRSDHTLMLLTKRPHLLLAWQRGHFPDGLPSWVWVGCTVEDQRRADERIPLLLQVRADVRFLSVEPLLGPVVLTRALEPRWGGGCLGGCLDSDLFTAWDGAERCHRCHHPLGGAPAPKIGWVIVGGESGPGARPMHPDWVRSLRDQCVDAGVPFHFKQWGEWVPDPGGDRCIVPDGRTMPNLEPDGQNGRGTARILRIGKHAAGRLLDGRTWDEFPGAGEVSGG